MFGVTDVAGRVVGFALLSGIVFGGTEPTLSDGRPYSRGGIARFVFALRDLLASDKYACELPAHFWFGNQHFLPSS
ncbi:hypothetical protein [Halobiforma nitratireducens]|uniref:Uncharacterized protein n=1 Tax=Halobiforma nitratireducens JCM 10879 TaxID=1227454 RepID=M0M445_9EURY|nr:hypothetical protein [Halobiforma nitratireducens]EMA40562.1 hypothetical protein C446_07267 [Halobiforma nitratireducens JCM 10879]